MGIGGRKLFGVNWASVSEVENLDAGQLIMYSLNA